MKAFLSFGVFVVVVAFVSPASAQMCGSMCGVTEAAPAVATDTAQADSGMAGCSCCQKMSDKPAMDMPKSTPQQ